MKNFKKEKQYGFWYHCRRVCILWRHRPNRRDNVPVAPPQVRVVAVSCGQSCCPRSPSPLSHRTCFWSLVVGPTGGPQIPPRTTAAARYRVYKATAVRPTPHGGYLSIKEKQTINKQNRRSHKNLCGTAKKKKKFELNHNDTNNSNLTIHYIYSKFLFGKKTIAIFQKCQFVEKQKKNVQMYKSKHTLKS